MLFSAMPQDDPIAKLARQIDATERAERFLTDRDRITRLRQQGAIELHHLCASFVASVNGKLADPLLDLSPASFTAEAFRESGPNLIQIGSLGRQMQIAFEAPSELVSTEKFLVPYILEGEIRLYNQKMLERLDIRSRMIFFCVEKDAANWRYFDWRTRSSGILTGELLASLLEPLF
jgi:hypothetical protein